MDFLKPTKRIPLPHISIALDDHSNRPFRPGARVSGTITLHSQTPRQLIHAEVIFFGRAVTHLVRIDSQGTSIHRRALFYSNESNHYHDDACLFRWTQDLSGNAAIEANQTCTWRFNFTFGDFAKLVGPSLYSGPTVNSGIYAQGQHPLPPSFERYFNDHHYAFVEYRLQAVFQFVEVPEPATVHIPLSFFPVGGWPDPARMKESVRDAEIFRSRKLLNDQRHSRHSFRDSLSSDGPSVEVVVRASLNTQAIANSVTPLHVCVEIHNPSSPSVTVSQIILRIKSVTLYQVVLFRARQVKGHGGKYKEYQEIGEDGTLLATTPESVPAKPQVREDAQGPFNYYPATFEVRMPNTVAPSFNTFNINNNYQMKAVIEAEICGKVFKHSCDVESFTILPPT